MAAAIERQTSNWRVTNSGAGGSSTGAPSYNPVDAASKRGPQAGGMSPGESSRPTKSARSGNVLACSRDRLPLPPLPGPTAPPSSAGPVSGASGSSVTGDADLVNVIRAAAARSPEVLQVVLQLLLAKQAEVASAGVHAEPGALASLGVLGTSAQPAEQATPTVATPAASVGLSTVPAAHGSGALQHFLRQRVVQAASQQASHQGMGQDHMFLLQALFQQQQSKHQQARSQQQQALQPPQQQQQQQLQQSLLPPPQQQQVQQHLHPQQQLQAQQHLQPWQEPQCEPPPELQQQGSGEGTQRGREHVHIAQDSAGNLETQPRMLKGLQGDERAAAAATLARSHLEAESNQSGKAATYAVPATVQALLASALQQVQARLVAGQVHEPSPNDPSACRIEGGQSSCHVAPGGANTPGDIAEGTSDKDMCKRPVAALLALMDACAVECTDASQNLAEKDPCGSMHVVEQVPAESTIARQNQADVVPREADASIAAEAGSGSTKCAGCGDCGGTTDVAHGTDWAARQRTRSVTSGAALEAGSDTQSDEG
jgi:hypothetical protein